MEVRLHEVADTAERMHAALGIAVGTLFRGDPDLRTDLDTVVTLFGRSPQQMEDWLFFAAYVGACQVLAGVWAHNANIKLSPLVSTMPGDREPRLFFEEVSEDAVYTARACDLQGIVKEGTER